MENKEFLLKSYLTSQLLKSIFIVLITLVEIIIINTTFIKDYIFYIVNIFLIAQCFVIYKIYELNSNYLEEVIFNNKENENTQSIIKALDSISTIFAFVLLILTIFWKG